ncbi:hypothetical protein HMPREF1549_03243 [Actinomyces johnsonii F0510]|uniref:Uncharacterized protein n=1 Tax=Actinomyces johnsonii F0510 TaxID=1227262 RepID=U1PYV5_9ACTO|nr:hypothetical protein HMPREF1549_03243 [Actinomyces johnsonii F0510]
MSSLTESFSSQLSSDGSGTHFSSSRYASTIPYSAPDGATALCQEYDIVTDIL